MAAACSEDQTALMQTAEWLWQSGSDDQITAITP
jgi:hypothetical protein